MKLNNKILILFFILISILFININCFATSTETEKVINYEGYEFPEFPSDYDNYNYKYIVFNPDTKVYSLLLSTSKMYYSSDVNFINNYIYSGSFTSPDYDYYYFLNVNFKRYIFKPELDNSSWTFFDDFNTGVGDFFTIGFKEGKYIPIFATENIINDDDNSTFFYKTPFLHFTNTQSNFSVSFFQPLGRVLAEVIPVGVVILAAMVTVSLVAYFKFWRT